MSIPTISMMTFAILLSCAKKISVDVPTDAPLIYAADRTYAYVQTNRGEWVVISKTGPHDKELCPKGAVCTIEAVGTTYIIRRIK